MFGKLLNLFSKNTQPPPSGKFGAAAALEDLEDYVDEDDEEQNYLDDEG